MIKLCINTKEVIMAVETSEFEQYVDRFAKSNGITPEEAREHYLVQMMVKVYYDEKGESDRREIP